MSAGPCATWRVLRRLGIPRAGWDDATREPPCRPGTIACAVRLMQAIVQRFAQQREVRRAQGFQQECDPLHVENCVAARDHLRQHRARCLGRQAQLAASPPRGKRLRPACAQHPQCSRNLATHRESAEQRRGDVVRMPLQLAGRVSISCSSSGPATASNSRSPATVAAALLPSPPFIGISLSTSMSREGIGKP